MNSTLLRTLMIYAIILPLAVMLGWMTVDLAYWDRTSFAVLAGVVFVLLIPALLKWYHPILIFSWSAFITLFFLPGKPALWMVMSVIGVGVALLNRIILKRQAFYHAPPVTLALLLLGAVILGTALLRGGIGLSITGSSMVGGKAYISLLAGIVGYFAITSQTIPVEKARLYVGLFFLSGLISVFSNLIYFAGPSFYFLYLIFPVDFAGVQAASETLGTISRVAGFSTGAVAICHFMLARYGVRGLFEKWWRVGVVGAALALGLLGGYRSVLVGAAVLFMILFVAEGLLRTRLFPLLLLLGALGLAALMPLTPKLPRSVQRSLSFLPVQVDPWVKADAQNSLEWRFQIWRALLPELPNYFWLGKGYTLNPTDLYLTQQAQLRGRASTHELALQSGTYHSGPLTLYVPFGAPGMLAFLLFLGTSMRCLYLNYRNGVAELRVINRFLLAYFTARTIFFFTAFGDLAGDLYLFAGIVGLSVAMNKGVCLNPARALQPVAFRGTMALKPAASTTV